MVNESTINDVSTTDNENTGYIYWTESGGAIKSISTDGSREKTILTVSGTPLDIALYLPGEKLY